MQKITYSVILVLLLSACSFDGQGVDENEDVEMSDDTESVQSVVEMSEGVGEAVGIESHDEVEIVTKDWFTYRSEEYGFKFRYRMQKRRGN
jgi:hypothetical protein